MPTQWLGTPCRVVNKRRGSPCIAIRTTHAHPRSPERYTGLFGGEGMDGTALWKLVPRWTCQPTTPPTPSLCFSLEFVVFIFDGEGCD